MVAAAIVITGAVAQVEDSSHGGFLSQQNKAPKPIAAPPGDA